MQSLDSEGAGSWAARTGHRHGDGRSLASRIVAGLVGLATLLTPVVASADTALSLTFRDFADGVEASDGAYCWRGYALKLAATVTITDLVVAYGPGGSSDDTTTVWSFGTAVYPMVEEDDGTFTITGDPVAAARTLDQTGAPAAAVSTTLALAAPVMLTAGQWYLFSSGLILPSGGDEEVAEHLSLVGYDERLVAALPWVLDYAPLDPDGGKLARGLSLGWCADDEDGDDLLSAAGFPDLTGLNRDPSNNTTSTLPPLGFVGGYQLGPALRSSTASVAPTVRLSCTSSASGVVMVGATVVCTVSGGDPGIDILWQAAYNPVFATAGVTLDAAGAGTFSFLTPAAAAGGELTVELVDWIEPVSLGVVGRLSPTSVSAGEGPAGPVGHSVFGLLAAVGAAVAVRRQAITG